MLHLFAYSEFIVVFLGFIDFTRFIANSTKKYKTVLMLSSLAHYFCHGAAINTPVLVQYHRCMLRVLDSFGTEPEFNHAHYAQSKGHKTPWGKWNLNPQQFNTMFRKLTACQHTQTAIFFFNNY